MLETGTGMQEGMQLAWLRRMVGSWVLGPALLHACCLVKVLLQVVLMHHSHLRLLV